MTENSNFGDGGSRLMPTRRYLLLGTTAVSAVGVVGAAVPFVRAWTPSARAKALGAPIKVDVSRLEPGELLGPIPAWRGQPIFVVNRTPEAIASLETNFDMLADPDSRVESQQPDYARNPYRSIRPEIGIFVGLCTHLGCSPKYLAKLEPGKLDSAWTGGFFCPCHGSKFDLAGRVAKNLPAPTNLLVPPHSYESTDVVVVGVDKATA